MTLDEELLLERIVSYKEELVSLEWSERKALAELGRVLLFIADEIELDEDDRQVLAAAREAHRACQNQRNIIANAERSLEALQRADRHGRPRICPRCHTEILSDDMYCTGCGAKVSDLEFPEKTGDMCPHCRRAVEPDDKFCSLCGASLRAKN